MSLTVVQKTSFYGVPEFTGIFKIVYGLYCVRTFLFNILTKKLKLIYSWLEIRFFYSECMYYFQV